MLLLPGRVVRIARVLLPIGLRDEGYGVTGGANLGTDRFTLPRSLAGPGRVRPMRCEPGSFLRYQGQLSTFGPRPLVGEFREEMLLLPDRVVRILRIFFTVRPVNKGNGGVGGANL